MSPVAAARMPAMLRPPASLRALAAVAALATSPLAAAHDARPLGITMVEQTAGIYRAVVRVPPSIEAGNRPEVRWPEGCTIVEQAPLALAAGSTSLVRCDGGIEARTIRIAYPAYNPSITTLIRLLPAGEPAITAVLPPDRLAWTVPAEPTLAGVVRDYLSLGFRHIWEGPDHLLFVAGLLLLARTPRRVFWAVTGFTAAHSITLSLAALGLLRLPVEPVEAMIALSILFLAAEIARDEPTSFSSRFPVALSFVFGLLHGFGFASALGEIGLPRAELVAGLLSFNLGVEAGQLAFIAAAVALITAIRLLRRARAGPDPRHLPAPGLAGAYCLGIPAAFWCIERTAAAFGI